MQPLVMLAEHEYKLPNNSLGVIFPLWKNNAQAFVRQFVFHMIHLSHFKCVHRISNKM